MTASLFQLVKGNNTIILFIKKQSILLEEKRGQTERGRAKITTAPLGPQAVTFTTAFRQTCCSASFSCAKYDVFCFFRLPSTEQSERTRESHEQVREYHYDGLYPRYYWFHWAWTTIWKALRTIIHSEEPVLKPYMDFLLQFFFFYLQCFHILYLEHSLD